MKVVIAGARSRYESADHKLVNDLITGLVDMYPQLYIVTTGIDKGVGKIVKDRLVKGKGEPVEAECITYECRVFSDSMARPLYAEFMRAKAQSLFAVGEEFHLFMDREQKGMMAELLQMVKDNLLPHSVYLIGEQTGPKLIK